MLDANRALELARAARGALECRLFGNVFPQKQRFAARSRVIQVTPQSQDDFLRVEDLPGIAGRTMFRATAAFDARVRLQRVDPRHVFSRGEPEVFVAFQRRNAAEAGAPQKYRERAERQVQVLGMRNQRKKRE